ncbi:MAG: hypothetical protein ACXVKJ_18320, partial [Ilumatobacteraceae bacterium]
MSIPTSERVIDLDVTRAIALIGVAVMNYHGYLIDLGGSVGESTINRFFDPWNGPLSTRFAATFVLVAGMGITLMTNRGRLTGDRARRSIDRWTLIRRGFLLYAFGFVSSGCGGARSCSSTEPSSSPARCCSRCAPDGSS